MRPIAAAYSSLGSLGAKTVAVGLHIGVIYGVTGETGFPIFVDGVWSPTFCPKSQTFLATLM
jgi:hypothetical protein